MLDYQCYTVRILLEDGREETWSFDSFSPRNAALQLLDKSKLFGKHNVAITVDGRPIDDDWEVIPNTDEHSPLHWRLYPPAWMHEPPYDEDLKRHQQASTSR